MQRGLATAAAALVLGAACYVLLGFFVGRGVALEQLVLFTAAMTLMLAALAVGFSLRAMLRAAAMHSDIARLSRTLDQAVSGLAQRGDRDASAVNALREIVERKLASPTPVGPAAPPAETAPTNVVMLPARRFRPEVVAAARPAGEEEARLLQAVDDAMRAGQPGIGLRRLVSVSRGETTGYDVLAHIPLGPGASVDVDALPDAASDSQKASFSRWLLAGAVETARRSLVGDGDMRPLGVRAAEALLSDGRELLAAVDALSSAPDIAARMMIVLPAAALQADAGHADALALIASTGAALGADDWRGETGSLEALTERGVAAFRIPAERLLGLDAERLLAPPVTLIETAAARGLPLVATGVASDEQEVAMMDLGVAQMTGPRFAGPRRLKPRSRRDASAV